MKKYFLVFRQSAIISFKFAKSALDKELMHYAASLSFHTFLAIIPFIFISLSMFLKMPSFEGYYAKIKEFIFANLLPSNQEAFSAYIDQFLANSTGLGVMGLIAVIFTSIMFFADYEYVISKITNVKTRGFWQGLSVYWTLITLMPLALGLSFWLSNHVQKILLSSDFTRWINFIAIFPYLIVWAIFTVTYAISINKPLKPKAVIASSMISSGIWEISKLLFVQYAFYNKTYESIYGSFSVLLFFFVWIYLSWIVFLFGARLCSVINNYYEKSNKTDENRDI